MTGSAVVGTVLSSGFCICVSIPVTTCALLLLSRILEAGHGGGRLSGWISHGLSLMPDPPGQSVQSPIAIRVGDGVVEEVGTGLMVSCHRVVLCDQVCCGWLWCGYSYTWL